MHAQLIINKLQKNKQLTPAETEYVCDCLAHDIPLKEDEEARMQKQFEKYMKRKSI